MGGGVGGRRAWSARNEPDNEGRCYQDRGREDVGEEKPGPKGPTAWKPSGYGVLPLIVDGADVGDLCGGGVGIDASVGLSRCGPSRCGDASILA